ncbi:unnamed protein product [Larinioides sclopetarius]|uniref:Uncharacterized protein n=1 Tax=Larinioides sclopetarius TaxID=280406 RepID=A0AAV1ZU99_9ARAC
MILKNVTKRKNYTNRQIREEGLILARLDKLETWITRNTNN